MTGRHETSNWEASQPTNSNAAPVFGECLPLPNPLVPGLNRTNVAVDGGFELKEYTEARSAFRDQREVLRGLPTRETPAT